MADRLVGITAKIKRAEKHIRELEKASNAFFELNPYAVISGNDTDGNYVFVLQGKGQPPVAISTVIGDVISNLRAALDHLYTQLMDKNGCISGPGDYFPIADTSAKFKAMMPRVEKKVGHAAMLQLSATESYQGGGGDGIWQINYLSNTDKHRLLIPVVGSMMGIHIQPNDPASPIEFRRVRMKLEHGAILHQIDKMVDRSKMDMNPTFTFEIAFGDPQITQGEAIAPILLCLLNLVNATVEPFGVLLT
ncbi:MAG: hypothetical protein HYY02_01060 [Chloroflexi bacterium]|nr:hypothetical protein [Chloroflexota bacterium]